MHKNREGLAERLGRAANELDIDFSRLTLAGWAVAALALGGAGAAAYFAWAALPPGRRGNPAALLGLGGIALAVALFLGLRWLANAAGVALVRPAPPTDTP